MREFLASPRVPESTPRKSVRPGSWQKIAGPAWGKMHIVTGTAATENDAPAEYQEHGV